MLGKRSKLRSKRFDRVFQIKDAYGPYLDQKLYVTPLRQDYSLDNSELYYLAYIHITKLPLLSDLEGLKPPPPCLQDPRMFGMMARHGVANKAAQNHQQNVL